MDIGIWDFNEFERNEAVTAQHNRKSEDEIQKHILSDDLDDLNIFLQLLRSPLQIQQEAALRRLGTMLSSVCGSSQAGVIMEFFDRADVTTEVKVSAFRTIACSASAQTSLVLDWVGGITSQVVAKSSDVLFDAAARCLGVLLPVMAEVPHEVLQLSLDLADVSQAPERRLAGCRLLPTFCFRSRGASPPSSAVTRIQALCQDTNVHVRKEMAKHLRLILTACASEAATTVWLPELLLLLRDEEVDVKLESLRTCFFALGYLEIELVEQDLFPFVVHLIAAAADWARRASSKKLHAKVGILRASASSRDTKVTDITAGLPEANLGFKLNDRALRQLTPLLLNCAAQTACLFAQRCGSPCDSPSKDPIFQQMCSALFDAASNVGLPHTATAFDAEWPALTVPCTSVRRRGTQARLPSCYDQLQRGAVTLATQLLHHPEPDCRAVVAATLPTLTAMIGRTHFGRVTNSSPESPELLRLSTWIHPLVTALMDDADQSVREQLSAGFHDLCLQCSPELNAQLFVDCVCRLLRDSADVVGSQIIKSAPSWLPCFSASDTASRRQAYNSILPELFNAIGRPAVARSWRLQVHVLAALRVLCFLHPHPVAVDACLDTVDSYLNNGVFVVQRAAGFTIAWLSRHAPTGATRKSIISAVSMSLLRASSWRIRRLVVDIFRSSLWLFSKAFMYRQWMPLLLTAAADPVANVRSYVAQTMLQAAQHLRPMNGDSLGRLGSSARTTVVADVLARSCRILRTLSEDTDEEVAVHASAALPIYAAWMSDITGALEARGRSRSVGADDDRLPDDDVVGLRDQGACNLSWWGHGVSIAVADGRLMSGVRAGVCGQLYGGKCQLRPHFGASDIWSLKCDAMRWNPFRLDAAAMEYMQSHAVLLPSHSSESGQRSPSGAEAATVSTLAGSFQKGLGPRRRSRKLPSKGLSKGIEELGSRPSSAASPRSSSCDEVSGGAPLSVLFNPEAGVSLLPFVVGYQLSLAPPTAAIDCAWFLAECTLLEAAAQEQETEARRVIEERRAEARTKAGQSLSLGGTQNLPSVVDSAPAGLSEKDSLKGIRNPAVRRRYLADASPYCLPAQRAFPARSSRSHANKSGTLLSAGSAISRSSTDPSAPASGSMFPSLARISPRPGSTAAPLSARSRRRESSSGMERRHDSRKRLSNFGGIAMGYSATGSAAPRSSATGRVERRRIPAAMPKAPRPAGQRAAQPPGP